MRNLLIKTIWLQLFITILLIPHLQAQKPGGGQRGREGELPKIGKVEGTVVDSDTENPLMYASVVLFNHNDSTMVSGAIADEYGRFSITEVPPGVFYLSISFVGYPTQEVNSIKITFREREYDAGLIKVQASASLLSEVTIEAAKELMETGLDKRVINVGQELTAIGGTGLEIMQNIPSVAVDFEGNVSLRGSTNVTILIDGRPSTLTGLSGSEALEQIPAEMIENVEIITNPSVRYDPEGTSGIINVVLKKEKRPGYNGMASISASTNKRYSASVNLNYKINKVNLFANYNNRLFSMEGFGNSLRTSFLPNTDTTFLMQDMDYIGDMTSHNAQLGFDYEINDKNTLTFSTRYTYWDRMFDNNTYYNLYSNESDISNLFLRDNELNMLHNAMSYALNYKKTFDKKHRELVTDIVFNNRVMNRQEDFVQQYFENNFDSPSDSPDDLEKTNMDGNNWMLSLQTDYIHPLGEDTKLETGVKGYLRQLDTDFNFENYDRPSGEWLNNESFSNRFIYREQVYAAYGIYSTMLGLYSVQAGLRLEGAIVDADQVTLNEQFTKEYFSYFPSLHIRRNFENNHSLQISYSKRINRPHNRNINPFVRYNSEYDISYGNPNLDPEYIHSFELGYTKYWETTTLNPSIFYRNTQGMITRFRTLNENGVTETTYENLNQGMAYGVELVASQTIAKWWKVNGTVSYFRRIVEGAGAQMDIENDSYSYSARLVNNFNLPKGWNIQLNGYYRSPIIMLQGEMKEMYSADIGVRKNLLNNKATITLRVSDIFDTQKFEMYNYGDNFTMEFDRKRNSRMVYLGFSYRINEYDRRRDQRRDSEIRDNGGDIDIDEF